MGEFTDFGTHWESETFICSKLNRTEKIAVVKVSEDTGSGSFLGRGWEEKAPRPMEFELCSNSQNFMYSCSVLYVWGLEG